MIDALWKLLGGGSFKDSTLLFATRQRFLTFASLLTFVVAATWVTLTAGTVVGGRPIVAALCGVAPVLFLPISYMALRKSVNLDWLAHAYLILLYVVVTLVAAALGGVVSTTSFFLMLIPLLATLALGVRAGVAWVAIVALTYAGLHFGRAALPPSTYEALGTAPHDWMRMEHVSFWNACMMTLLALSSCLAVANFRVVVQNSSSLLVQAALETRDAVAARKVAEEISRSKSEFIANVTHELRTPLDVIIGYSELLIEKAQDQGDKSDAIDNARVLDAATRLLLMVNEMLRLSSIDAGQHKINVDECDVNALVRDAVIALTPAASANDNRIVVKPHTTSGFWICDGPKLDHCLRHLLSNAAKFTRDGVITVRVRSETEKGRMLLCLDVADTGVGIATAQLEEIFVPFGSADTSAERPQKGTGLGLAVTRRLAQLMGGDVIVESVPGRGSCFTLSVSAEFLVDAPVLRPHTILSNG